MTADHDLELRLASWLRQEAATIVVPDSLHRRILDIPDAQHGAASSWWHRFATWPALSGAAVATVVAAVFLATSVFGVFDAPAGADGEACNNRQVQRALDKLRDADGYRWTTRELQRTVDLDAPLDMANPTFVWADGWTSEGAYLAPDRARDVRTSQPGITGDRGYEEHLQVDGHTYELRSGTDGEPIWVEMENWPAANWVWAYVANQFPAFSIPGVTSLDWDGAVPDGLPGAAGCVAAAHLPEDYGMPGRIAALRVDVRTGLAVGVLIGPDPALRGNEGETQLTWELDWTLPSAAEFVAPTEVRPDPNTSETNETLAPTPTPIAPGPDAWPVTDLPLPSGASDLNTVYLNRFVPGERYLLFGSALDDNGGRPVLWESDDGVSWRPVDLHISTDATTLEGGDWNGSQYVAIGYTDTGEATWDSFRPSSWVSSDGRTWERGGPIGPTEGSGLVANPGPPVAGGPGWVAGGAIFENTARGQQQTPALFWSEDGVDWTTAELTGIRSGSIGTPIVLADGSLLATGCEFASDSTVTTGACYARTWHSADGITWESGELINGEVASLARWGDRAVMLLLSSADPTNGDPFAPVEARIVASADGRQWDEIGTVADSAGRIGRLFVVGEELVVQANVAGSGGNGRAILLRSRDGESWDTIELRLPEGALGNEISGVVPTPAGLSVLGWVLLDENGSSRAVTWTEP